MRDIAAVRGVVFDLDDTLIDWGATERTAMDAVCQAHIGVHPTQHVHDLYGEVKRENFEAFLAHGTWSYVGDRLAQLLRRLEMPDDVAPLLETFAASVRATLRLLPGADGLLDAARQGRQIALLTNGPADVQRPKVDALGLGPLVHHVAIAGETGLWKPDAGAFLAVMRRMGTRPEETLMVGDSLHFDIRPARALGMRTCWVGGLDPQEADLVVPEAAMLTPLLAAPSAKSS